MSRFKTLRRATRYVKKRLTSTHNSVHEPAIDHIGSEQRVVNYSKPTYLFSNCVVWPHYSVAAKTNLISETIIYPNRTEFLYHKLKNYKIIPMKGVVTSIGDVWHNYYHRYVDMIPKLFALRAWSDLESLTILVPRHFTDDDLNIVRLMSPLNADILQVPETVRFKCSNYVHLPLMSMNPDKPRKYISSMGFLPNDYMHHYRTSVLNHYDITQNMNKRIYISRSDANKRKIVNEADLTHVLQEYGFETHTLSGMSIHSQVSLFNSASIIIAQHGAALTNIMYCQPSCHVVEIHSQKNRSEIHYEPYCHKNDLQYHSLYLSKVNPASSGRSADGFIDLEMVRSVMGEIL